MQQVFEQPLKAWFSESRFTYIPDGHEIELTSVLQNGRRRVHRAGNTEGMQFVMVDEAELLRAT